MDDDCAFPSKDNDLEKVLLQYDSFKPSVHAATFLSTASTVVLTADQVRAPLTKPYSPPSVASRSTY